MSSAPSARKCSSTAGTSVLCPAAWLETPITCTSFSMAWRAASSGVWKSGPMSTSKPRSAKAVAVLAELDDEEARPAALLDGEGLDLALHPAERLVALVGGTIDAGDRAHHG